MKHKRIFIGPKEIAGYYVNLTKGFTQIGVDCNFVTYTPHPFGYGEETKSPILLRLVKFFNRYRGKQGKPFILRVLVALSGKVCSGLWTISAIFKYDVFIFGFGASLIPYSNRDLRILKLLGKTVVSVMTHGSEARPAYINGAIQSLGHCNEVTAKHLADRASSAKNRLIRHLRFSTFVIGSAASTSQFASKRFINSAVIGKCFVPDKMSKNFENAALKASISVNNVIQILHSPSHPVAKGSSLIIKAIKNLKNKGHSIEFVLLHDKPHSEVIKEIQRCDFIVDQVFSDTPMAGFATEAAWFGKPAVVGGYGFDYLKTFVPEGMWPPSKTCHPDEIEQAIESLVVNREERLRLGTEAQKFVHEKWNAAEVARRYLKIIEGDIPDEWWLDPRSVTYLEGCGQPIERSKQNIRRMVEQFGVESLQLSHRPDLEQAFLEFAKIRPKTPGSAGR